MPRLLAGFEKIVVSTLIIFMVVVIVLATVDVGWVVVQGVLIPPSLLTTDELLHIFGAFLFVLVGIELLETIKAYLSDQVVHAEIVMVAAMIAVARKIIVIDVKDAAPATLVAIAALVLALSVGYYLVKQSNRP